MPRWGALFAGEIHRKYKAPKGPMHCILCIQPVSLMGSELRSENYKYYLELASVEHPPPSSVGRKPSVAPWTSILSCSPTRSTEESLESAVILTSHSGRQETDNNLNRKIFFSLKHNSTSRTIDQNKALHG